MITISRKLAGLIKVQQIYFPEDVSIVNCSTADLIGITQSIIPMEGLRPLETLQVDLTQSEDDLWSGISKSTRKQIRQAQRNYQFHYLTFDNPTDEQIRSFQEFYNTFARAKNTHLCKSFNVKTLQLLRDQKALFMSVSENEDKEPICYRLYALDEKRAMALYNASHFRLTDNHDQKKMIGGAHRVQKWKDFLTFKEIGLQIVDYGGLTDIENIRMFKLQFGGKIVTEYSGYLSRTVLGNLIVRGRNWMLSN